MWFERDKWDLVREAILKYLKCEEHDHTVEHLDNGIWTDGPWKQYYNNVQSSVRRRVLNPFLFKQPYDNDVFYNWMYGAEYLLKAIFEDRFDQKELFSIEVLDTFAKNITHIFLIFKCLSDVCVKIKELYESLQETSKILINCTEIEAAKEILNKDFIYKIILDHLSLENDNTVVYSIAYSVCFCMFFSDSPDSTLLDDDILSDEEQVDQDQGNKLYNDKNFEAALPLYSKILKSKKYCRTIYCNRAETYLHLLKLEEAKIDARRCNILEPGWCKPYITFACALELENKLHDAHLTAAEGFSHCSDFKPCTSKIVLVKKVEDLKNKCSSCSIPELLSSDDDDDVIENGTNVSANLKVFNEKTKTGTKFLTGKKYICAIENFESALQIAQTLKDHKTAILEEQITSVRYALGVAHFRSGDYENLKKALNCFEDMINNQNCDHFPAVFYMHGLTLVTLFRFEEALDTLNYGLNIVNTGVLKQYCWPGTKLVIEETVIENLKENLLQLISKCRDTPKPDGKCRLESCSFTKNIFYIDPNFKGCYFLYCTGNCRVDYHTQCWKSIRDEKEKTEKDFLDKICMTPDCGNFVYLIEIIDKNGEAVKQLESSVHGKNKTVKHRKSKLEKKTEIRTIKKQKKHEKGKKLPKDDDNEVHESDHGHESDREEEIEDKEEEKQEEKAMETQVQEKNLCSNPVIYEMDAKPAYIFKKEEATDQDNTEKKHSKVREKKKPKKNVIGIDEFCRDSNIDTDNAYLERVQRLQLSKEFVEECDIVCDTIECLNVIPKHINEIIPSSPPKNLRSERVPKMAMGKEHLVPKKPDQSQASNIAELDIIDHQKLNLLDQLDSFTEPPNLVYTNHNSKNKLHEDIPLISTKATENEARVIPNQSENSLEYQGTLKYNACSLDTDIKMLEQVRQKTNKLTNNFNAAAFQLQVILLSLSEDLQVQFAAGILNNFSNRPPEFWQRLNSMMDVKFSIAGSKDNEKAENVQMVNESLENELAKVKDAYVSLQMVNKTLEEDLSSLRDANVRLHKTHSVYKYSKDQEVMHLHAKSTDLLKEMKEKQSAFEMEIKRVNSEKQKVQDEMAVLSQETKCVAKYNERIEELIESNDEKQRELEILKSAHEKLRSGNDFLFSQLDELEIKNKKAMELLIEERRLLGNMVLKTAIDKTHAMILKLIDRMKSLNPSSSEYGRLETQNLAQNQHLEKLVGIQREFLNNISECAKTLKTNEEIFTFDEIPPVPSIPSWPEVKPPGFSLPTTSANNYFSNMQAPNSLSMAFSNGQIPLFPYAGQTSILDNIFPSQTSTSSSVSLKTSTQSTNSSHNLDASNYNLGINNNFYDQPTPISISGRTLSSVSLNSKAKSDSISPELPPRLKSEPKREQALLVSNQNPVSSYHQLTPISISETIGSQASSPETSQRVHSKMKSCYDKIVELIQLKFPTLSQDEIITYIKRYRTEREKCSGKTNIEVASLVTTFIIEDHKNHYLNSQKVMELRKPKPILRDMSIPSTTSTQVSEVPSVKMWKVSSKESGNFKSRDCSICLEPLNNGVQIFRAECGHNCFHEVCVRPWLKDNATCPICRTYLLLPDEFPEL